MPLKLPLRRHVVSGRKSAVDGVLSRINRVVLYLAVVALVKVKHRMIIRLRNRARFIDALLYS